MSTATVTTTSSRYAILTFVVGLMVTAGWVAHYRQSLDDFRTRRFQEFVDRTTFHLRDRVLNYEHGLRGTRSTLIAVGPTQMTLQQFRDSMQTREPMREFPGSRGFGFIQRVPLAGETRFLADAARQGRDKPQIRQLSPGKDERFVVKYIEPEELNRAAVGLDIGSEPIRRDAMRQAMRSGAATLTRPVTLVQADGKQGHGFLLLLPVYPVGQSPATDGERESAALGTVFTPLVIDEVLADINPVGDGVNLMLTDVDAVAGNLQFSGPSSPPSPKFGLVASRPIKVFGREWRADFSADRGFAATLPHDYSVSIALLGAIVSFLIAAALFREMRIRGRLRQVNERLQLLIQRAPSALALFDTEMRYLAVSQQWLDDFDLRDRKVIGECHYTLFPNVPESWRRIHRRALGGEELSNQNDQVVRHDGSVQWLRWAVRPWYRAGDTVGGIIIFSEDITQQQQLMTALKHAKESAEAANQAKTLFLGKMSHELKTPLHQIYGVVSLLQRDALTDKQQRRLDLIKESLQRLDQVIGGILMLVDLESQSTTIEYAPLDLPRLVADTVEALAPRAVAKQLQLTVDVAALHCPVTGDVRHIRTILTCYLENALTFCNQGSIRVRATPIDENDQRILVRLSVQDEGIGIPEEKVAHLFDSFNQLDNSHTRQHGGAGVGLAIARKLAMLMDGDVGCESVPGQGSTFWATIGVLKASRLAPAANIEDFAI